MTQSSQTMGIHLSAVAGNVRTELNQILRKELTVKDLTRTCKLEKLNKSIGVFGLRIEGNLCPLPMDESPPLLERFVQFLSHMGKRRFYQFKVFKKGQEYPVYISHRIELYDSQRLEFKWHAEISANIPMALALPVLINRALHQ